jgi:hypothetical protein
VHRGTQAFVGYLKQPFIIAAPWNCDRNATALRNRDLTTLLGGISSVIRIVVG